MLYHHRAAELHVQYVKLYALTNKRLIKLFTNLPVYVCTFTDFTIILEAIMKLGQSPGGYYCTYEPNDRKAPCSNIFANSRY